MMKMPVERYLVASGDPESMTMADQTEHVERYLVETGPVAPMADQVSRFMVDGSMEHAQQISAECDYSTGVLLSFYYFKNSDLSLLNPRCSLIGDSGAFSAYTLGGEVTLDQYSAWLDKWQHRLRFSFNLDVMGDHQASFRQWKQLASNGFRTVPVIHYGTRPQQALPQYLDQGVDYLSMGGIIVPGNMEQRRGWVAYVFKWLRHNAPHVKVHGLGVHLSSRMMSQFPWSSTDSSAPGAAWRYGRAKLWDPRGSRWVTVPLDGYSMFRYGALTRQYGFEPSEVATCSGANREQMIQLVTRSECQASRDWNARHSRLIRKRQGALS